MRELGYRGEGGVKPRLSAGLAEPPFGFVGSAGAPPEEREGRAAPGGAAVLDLLEGRASADRLARGRARPRRGRDAHSRRRARARVPRRRGRDRPRDEEREEGPRA